MTHLAINRKLRHHGWRKRNVVYKGHRTPYYVIEGEFEPAIAHTFGREHSMCLAVGQFKFPERIREMKRHIAARVAKYNGD